MGAIDRLNVPAPEVLAQFHVSPYWLVCSTIHTQSKRHDGYHSGAARRSTKRSTDARPGMHMQ